MQLFFYNSVYNVMTLLQPALSAFYIQNIVITRRTRVDSCTHAVRQCVRLQLITPLNCRPPGCTLPGRFYRFLSNHCAFLKEDFAALGWTRENHYYVPPGWAVWSGKKFSSGENTVR